MAFQQDSGISSTPGERGHRRLCVTKVCDTFDGHVLLKDIAPAGHNLEALEPKSLPLFLRSSQIELKKNTMQGKSHARPLWNNVTLPGIEAFALYVGKDKNSRVHRKELRAGHRS